MLEKQQMGGKEVSPKSGAVEGALTGAEKRDTKHLTARKNRKRMINRRKG